MLFIVVNGYNIKEVSNMNLTLQEIIILIVAIAVIVSFVISLIKSSIKLALVGLAIMFLFSGFTWLPEKIQEWTGVADNTVTNPDDVDPDFNHSAQDVLNGVINEGVEIVNENKDSWIQSAQSLWYKILGVELHEGD